MRPSLEDECRYSGGNIIQNPHALGRYLVCPRSNETLEEMEGLEETTITILNKFMFHTTT